MELDMWTHNVCDCMHKPAKDQARQHTNTDVGGANRVLPVVGMLKDMKDAGVGTSGFLQGLNLW